MNVLTTIGRIFFGVGIAGIGIMHFFHPGIRPIIVPGLKDIPSHLSFIVYAVAVLLIGAGLLIAIGKKYNSVSLVMGAIFLLLFLLGHLPKFLAAGSFNEYWVNINKVIALTAGFLVISTIDAPKTGNKIMMLLAQLGPLGMYLFAIMLYNFGVGHFNNLKGISGIVPKYLPFPIFWTFVGGVALVGSAISIFSKYEVKKIMLLLALNLFIWLLLLHVYYTIRFPQWQEGENFIGAFTCLCFCGTALIISQVASKTKSNLQEL